MGLRSDSSWPKLGLEPNVHDPGTFGGFGKQITHTQESCFISIDCRRKMTEYIFIRSLMPMSYVYDSD